MTGYYKFMDIVFKINYVYPSFTEFAQDYTTNDTNFECEITTTKEKIIEWEKLHSSRQGQFPIPYLELLVIQYEIANFINGKNAFVFHGSSVYLDDPKNGFIIAALSGTGKSTHSRLLKESFKERIGYINDDKPFIQFKDENYYLYGSPWNGKEGRGENVKGTLKALFILVRDTKCFTVKAKPKEAIMFLIKQIHIPAGMERSTKGTEFIIRLCNDVPIYFLHADMSENAPLTSYKIMNELKEMD